MMSTNKSIKLSQYTEEMQKDIMKFYFKCFTALGWEYEPEGRHFDTVNIINEYCNKGAFWCLYDSDTLIGTVAVRTIDSINKICELKRLYILPEYQGNGYGGLLFKTALDHAKDNNYNIIRLDTQNDRSASRHLSEKYKFLQINRYNNNIHAELFYELNLKEYIKE